MLQWSFCCVIAIHCAWNMLFHVSVLLFSMLKVLDTCIPTQFVNNDGSLGGQTTTSSSGLTTLPGSATTTTGKQTTAINWTTTTAKFPAVSDPSATTTTSTTTTTTTMSTTTTTVTEPPFPCNNCPKVYDNTCQGFGIPNLLQWCPTAAEAGIEYTLGLITSIIPFIPAGSCGTIITCPLTTSLKIKIIGQEIPAPVFYAWCEESGANAGKWYTGTTFLKFELVSLACKPIL
ncbi:hypothetical protein CRE_00658 [Caenorhabditis remanei]|uniref:Uncharacterized protein n=1 Tax=Caenorhabditis remanei TaxID=31234 RepID=E3LDN9_CAERE|nr:hypothetical protein CRE_00658 [Caenorhabditis remanei]